MTSLKYPVIKKRVRGLTQTHLLSLKDKNKEEMKIKLDTPLIVPVYIDKGREES